MLRKIVLLVLCVCSWWVISNRIGTRLDVNNSNMQCSALNRTVPEFEVLVLSRSGETGISGARVVRYADLASYTAKTPGWSYLIPAGKEDEVKKLLASAPGNHADNDMAFRQTVDLQVQRMPDGKQRISLKSRDGINRACYIAGAKSISTLSYSPAIGRGRDAMYAFGAVIGIFVNGLLWLVGFGIIRLVGYLRKKGA